MRKWQKGKYSICWGLVVIVCVLLVSCGVNNGAKPADTIVGTWEWEWRYTNPLGETTISKDKITFYSDGSFDDDGTIVSKIESTNSGYFYAGYTYPRAWTYLENEGLLKIPTGNSGKFEHYKVTFKAGKMFLENVEDPRTREVEYTRVR